MSSDSAPTLEDFQSELERTAVQKKVVTRIPRDEVMDFAIAFFKERGYRANATGKPGQIFIMGGREGILPRVTGEITVRDSAGRTGSNLVTCDAAGERFGPAMKEFMAELRAKGKPAKTD